MLVRADAFAELRRHPLVVLVPDRVRARAYFRWAGGSRDGALADWLAAEEEELALFAERFLVLVGSGAVRPSAIEEHYDLIFSWSSSSGPLQLGDRRPRRCSICGQTREAGATFGATAHVLPELFGSGDLTTADECDSCNHGAGLDTENDLGAMLTADRAVTGMHGKRGVVRATFERDGTFVRHEDGVLVVGTREGGRNVVSSFTDEGVDLAVFRARYRPSRVARALAKITWQLLPPDVRAGFEPLRAHVQGARAWSRAEFYRVDTPGMRRVAVGLWCKRPGAPASLPPLVLLVATANQLLVWNAPDLSAGDYGEPVFPPLLRPFGGGAPPIWQVAVDGEVYAPAAMRPFPYKYGAAFLAHVHEETAVLLEGSDADGAFTLRTRLTTPEPISPRVSPIVQRLEGGDLIGALTVAHTPDVGRSEVQYTLGIAPSSEMPIEPTLRALRALWRGTPIVVRTESDQLPIMPPLAGGPVEREIPDLEEHLLLAERLAVIRERTGANVALPVTLDASEYEGIVLLAEGLRRGAVRKHAPSGAESDVRMPKAIALAMASDDALREGELAAACDSDWHVGAIRVDPGPVRIVLEGAALVEDPSSLLERVGAWADDAHGLVHVRYRSLRLEFLRHLPCDAAPQP